MTCSSVQRKLPLVLLVVCVSPVSYTHLDVYKRQTERLRSAAAQTGIDISLEVRSDDVSDASGVQRAGAGVKTGVLMLPVRNYNSTKQISCKNYSEQISAITEKFLNNI